MTFSYCQLLSQLAIAVPSTTKRLEDRITAEYYPKLSKLLPKVDSIALSTHHTLARTPSGEVLSCGRGEYGMLGVLADDGVSAVEESVA